MALRITHQSLFSANLSNLQTNLSRIQRTQEHLSSGKRLSTPSDEPAGTGIALRHRREIARYEQLLRNTDDGLGWLNTADTALQGANDAIARVRELLVSANNTGASTAAARESIALEIDAIRERLIGTANTEYLGRPIFGGTTTGGAAYDDAGNYVGDNGSVLRSVRPGTTVQVNVTGPDVFGPPGADLFQYLTDVVDHVRNDPTQLAADLGQADVHQTEILGALSTVGARYAQMNAMQSATQDDLLQTRTSLSEVEDVDLPATIVELQLQETAYQAALSATARSVQPSLMDFLR